MHSHPCLVSGSLFLSGLHFFPVKGGVFSREEVVDIVVRSLSNLAVVWNVRLKLGLFPVDDGLLARCYVVSSLLTHEGGLTSH